jgi:hypothetical protein
MRKTYAPRAFATLAEAHFANQPRCALWAKPGMGKTVMTLTHLDALHRVWGESRPTLVLAPLRVARDTWATEASKWQHLAGLDVVPVVGDAAVRKAALRRDVPIYTTNYEQLPWLVEHFGDAWPFGAVVADESTKLKGFRLRQGTQRAQALGRVAHKNVQRWINLTGTPASNGLEDLWGQTWFLDEGRRLGRTFSAFRDRWFQPVKAGQFHQWKAAPWAQDEVHNRLADICLTLDPRDWFDMREPVVNVVNVHLPREVRVKYREMQRELFTIIASTPVEAPSAAAKYAKCLQMAGGAVYLEDGVQWVELHQEKLDALEELADQTGDDPLLVAYHFKHEAARILARFPDALDLANADDLRAAQAGRGKLWLGHPASMGHGVDGLQEHCNTVVFFAQDPNLEHHDQILERVGPMRQMQAGKDRPVFLYYLVAQGTLDVVEMARRESKRSVQDLLMDFMKGEL